ncbi:DHH family phosphoesterase [bacterium]|nr:DHH family phosphoesterase [bacterium]
MVIANSLKKKFEKIKKEISRAKRILILTHRAPDGDAIGSVLSLGLFLKRKKKKPYIYALQLPQSLSFLPGFAQIKKKLLQNRFDLIFILDCPRKDRLEVPQDFSINPQKVISIDHHLKQGQFGNINIIVPNACSVCEILYWFFCYLGVKIDKKIATCLLCGVFTDSGGFSWLEKGALETIRDLIDLGADLPQIARSYNYISLSRAKLLAKMIERIEKDEKLNLIYSWLKISDFKEGKGESIFSEPPVFPDFLSQIGNADVYLLLLEHKNNKIKANLRSHRNIGKRLKCSVNVAEIAERFGGGGHKCAAGFKVKGTIPEVLKRVKNELKKLKKRV